MGLQEESSSELQRLAVTLGINHPAVLFNRFVVEILDSGPDISTLCGEYSTIPTPILIRLGDGRLEFAHE